jgi:hypothetical protein
MPRLATARNGLPQSDRLEHAAEREEGHDQEGREGFGQQVGRQPIDGDTVEMLDRERTGRKAGDQARGHAQADPEDEALDEPQRPGRVDLPHSLRPCLDESDQRRRRGEGHLESGLNHCLRLQQEDNEGGDRQGMQADRPSVGQDRSKGDRRCHGGPDGGRRRTRHDEVDRNGQEGECGRYLLARHTQNKSRPKRYCEPYREENEATDDRHVETADGDDVGEPCVSELVLGLSRDKGLVAGNHGRA